MPGSIPIPHIRRHGSTRDKFRARRAARRAAKEARNAVQVWIDVAAANGKSITEQMQASILECFPTYRPRHFPTHSFAEIQRLVREVPIMALTHQFKREMLAVSEARQQAMLAGLRIVNSIQIRKEVTLIPFTKLTAAEEAEIDRERQRMLERMTRNWL